MIKLTKKEAREFASISKLVTKYEGEISDIASSSRFTPRSIVRYVQSCIARRLSKVPEDFDQRINKGINTLIDRLLGLSVDNFGRVRQVDPDALIYKLLHQRLLYKFNTDQTYIDVLASAEKKVDDSIASAIDKLIADQIRQKEWDIQKILNKKIAEKIDTLLEKRLEERLASLAGASDMLDNFLVQLDKGIRESFLTVDLTDPGKPTEMPNDWYKLMVDHAALVVTNKSLENQEPGSGKPQDLGF
jgi:hypothetical protein